MTLNGTLEDFSPAGILKVLSADGRTGAVRFGGPHGCTVYLHRGQLYFARNEGTDAALATALVRPGRLSADGWGQAIDEAGDRPVVGELLVRNGAITSDLLASVVLSVVYDPLIDLFRDGTGEFDFEPDTVHWLGPFRAFPVDAIVGEVKKRVREVDEWSGAIPSLDSWVEASRTLPGNAAQVTILREDWELVTALSGPRTIQELATELGRGAYSTARVVNRLHQAGLVEVVSTDVEAQVVQLRPAEPTIEPDTDTDRGSDDEPFNRSDEGVGARPEPAPAREPAPVPDLETDPLLAMGLPHRTARRDIETRTDEPDPLTARIGDAIADALAAREGEAQADADATVTIPEIDPFSDMFASAADLLGGTPSNAGAVDDLDEVDHARPDGGSYADVFGGHGSDIHHDDLDADEAGAEERTGDPNAAWLEDLYAQFIDEPEAAAAAANGTKKRRRGEPNPVDVAFRTEEQDAEAKVSTLKRLMGALRKL
ncbi:MAG: DUF4388 domain-containing protein [Acidimicrobiales bacterium]|nr:DUF4388 domain-containing protein [Acidimicrobiales bacterium]